MRTSFHHQPEAQHPIFQLSTSWQADYPIFRTQSRHAANLPRAGTTRLTPSRPQVCSATGRPVAEQPAYTRREIDYPATVSSLVVSGMQFDQVKRRQFVTL